MSTDSNVEKSTDISTVEISDNLLLRRFYISRSPEPFLELVRRHTGMVYGTCFRIVANVHDAEELTQECFFELSLQALDVRTSLVGWLHRVATHRALNRIRDEKRRKTREQKAALENLKQDSEPAETTIGPSWTEISAIVDRAIEELPEHLRTPIVMNYLNGTTQAEVAYALGVHQSTVSRRLSEGIEKLRETIRGAGFVVPTATLINWLASQSLIAAPPTLTASLGKIGLAGVGSSIFANAGGSFLPWLASLAKGVMTFLLLPLAAGVIWGEVVFLLLLVAWCLYIGLRKPEWIRVLCYTRQFPSIYDWPFFPFARWTWKSPPSEWRIWMAFYLLTGLQLLGVVALLSHLSTPRWFLLSVLAVWQFYMGTRIWIRVRRCRVSFQEDSKRNAMRIDGALLLTYSLACAVLMAKLCVSPWWLSIPDNGNGVFWLNLFAIACWSSVLVWGAILVVGRYRCWLVQKATDPVPTNRFKESAPPRTLLVALMSIFMLPAFVLSWWSLLQDVWPVYVPFGDNVIASSQRQIFGLTLSAMDCLVFAILPLAYLYHRIPRIVWGVAFGIVGLVGALNLGLFAKNVIAAPVIVMTPNYAHAPYKPLKEGQFRIQLTKQKYNESQFRDNYMATVVIGDLMVASDVLISLQYEDLRAELAVPSDNHGLGSNVHVMIQSSPHEFKKGIPKEVRLTMALTQFPFFPRDPITKEKIAPKQVVSGGTMLLPENLSLEIWRDQSKFGEQDINADCPIGESIVVGSIQGKPITLTVQSRAGAVKAISQPHP